MSIIFITELAHVSSFYLLKESSWVKIFYQMDHFYIGLVYSPALKLDT